MSFCVDVEEDLVHIEESEEDEGVEQWFCQGISSVRHRGGRNIWGGSANVDKSATKCDGDRYECVKCCKGEKMCNHHGYSHTFGQRYLHSKFGLIYVDIDKK